MARHGENIYKRRDGRYEGRYVIGKTKEGKTRFGYVYARQLAEARKMLLEKKAAQQCKPVKAGARHISLSEWMSYWMENELLGSVKASSYHVYRRQIGNHLLPQLGNYDLSELTPGVIHGFVEDLEASGLAGSTTKGAYRLLSAALRFAQEEGIIEKNPCRKIKVHGTQSSEQRVLTQREQERIRSLSKHRTIFSCC